MTISNDAIATWHFGFNHKTEILQKVERTFSFYSIWIFWNLFKILNLLKQNELLVVTRLEFLGQQDKFKRLEIEDSSIENILNIIIQELMTNERNPYINFKGKTLVRNYQTYTYYSDILNISYDLQLGDINISTYSDCWVPIDRNDELQIKMAEENAPILERVLQSIKDIGYDNLMPNVDEEYIDELLPQKGFKIYLYDQAISLIDKKTLSSESIKVIEKYLWSNRD